MRDPGYLIEVGQYTQMALDRLKNTPVEVGIHTDTQSEGDFMAQIWSSSTRAAIWPSPLIFAPC